MSRPGIVKAHILCDDVTRFANPENNDEADWTDGSEWRAPLCITRSVSTVRTYDVKAMYRGPITFIAKPPQSDRREFVYVVPSPGLSRDQGVDLASELSSNGEGGEGQDLPDASEPYQQLAISSRSTSRNRKAEGDPYFIP
ncbi:9490_t:CDS:2 [Acaulospora colombiana]|uniref:9490_t:CDS:1 n=1 Tax=Acaulospora colombiana TaxID=27376 RepID=A0ACA9N092_9GLOM|nr:9490_t:CDS:2 [Acaulospora colombiana]